MSKIRVRYAPSPTGHLHIGNARTALFNYLYARHNGGDFIIRIEDTDLKRNIADGEKSQLENLDWLGMNWDESAQKPGKVGPYRQSERKEIYQPLIDQLLASNLAYKCYCTEEELEAEREAQRARGEIPRYAGTCAHLTPEEQAQKEAQGIKPVIRFRVPKNREYRFDDIVKGEIVFESDNVGGDFVIQKRDGMPTYNFAVAVDDHMMGITHVLRGDDHIANTPKQLMIYEAFGWKPVGEDEIFSQEQLIEMFDPNRLSKSPAAFDAKKLEWINNQYMKKMDLDRLTEMCVPFLQKAGRIKEDLSAEDLAWVKQLVALYQPQMSYAAQIVEVSELFFIEHPVLDEAAKEVLAGETVPTVLAAFKAQLEAMEEVTSDNVRAAIKAVQKETGVKGKNLFMPIRVAVSGQMHGPELPDTVALLGKEKALNHLNQVL